MNKFDQIEKLSLTKFGLETTFRFWHVIISFLFRVQPHSRSSSRMIVYIQYVYLFLFSRPRRVHRYRHTMSPELFIEHAYPLWYLLIILCIFLLSKNVVTASIGKMYNQIFRFRFTFYGWEIDEWIFVWWGGTNERTNKRMNEWMNEWKNIWKSLIVSTVRFQCTNL